MFLKRYLEHRMQPYSPWHLGGFILIGRCLGPLQPPGFQEVGMEAWVALSGGRKCQMVGQVFWLT